MNIFNLVCVITHLASVDDRKNTLAPFSIKAVFIKGFKYIICSYRLLITFTFPCPSVLLIKPFNVSRCDRLVIYLLIALIQKDRPPKWDFKKII